MIKNIGVKRIAEKSPMTTSLNWRWGYLCHWQSEEDVKDFERQAVKSWSVCQHESLPEDL